jgi:hypothetical protein
MSCRMMPSKRNVRSVTAPPFAATRRSVAESDWTSNTGFNAASSLGKGGVRNEISAESLSGIECTSTSSTSVIKRMSPDDSGAAVAPSTRS